MMTPSVKLNIAGTILAFAALIALIANSPNASTASVGAFILFALAWAFSGK
jgi:hypothetical protein